MLKKITLGLTFAMTLMVPSALADPCFLSAGCVWITPDDLTMPGYWVCPNPQTHADCKTPDGLR